jgi:hypothetical protein
LLIVTFENRVGIIEGGVLKVEHTTLQGVIALLEGARVHYEIFDTFRIYGGWA